MSELSYLEKLLDGVKVEWLPLAKVCRLINGRAYKQEELLSKGKYPVLRVGNFFTNQNWYYSDLELDQDKYCDNGDLLYAWSASFGPRIWHGGKSIYHYHIWKVVPDSNLICKQFLYYLLQWDTKALKDAHSTGSTMMHISKTTIEKRLVPIPCPDNPEKSLAIQSEIVRILDKFTALTAELTAELNMRKKQYNYYRDQLLSFKEGEVEWKTLGDISIKIASGRNKSRKSEGEYPVYGSTGLIGSTDKAAYSGKLILVARVGAYAGLVNAVAGHFDVSDNTLIIQPSDRWNVRFAFHQLTYMNLNQYAVGAGQPLITGGFLKNLMVPLPSLDEQTRIANILDKFDTLTNSITEGLPREIELRQKQYEYYRDMLFSFPKPEVAEA
ncbi:TPA: restriction endonuclease subunit S [Escherichia coli]|uniref:restriction endonuclease subunit S n=1 Tax=Escherichia coli TaxID=562 RepID=UPI000B7CA797|nr:restriction endonuclease subunit S [Escherichia coli]ELR5788101.1 restriction endonuclease subunit S [Escherichia coli]MCA7503052.1 restriction endonuclease subunit S [Escherichia coli]HAJ3985734.1 restriction endonuclease subunit S [Escherichia coli]HAJ4042394.1 restriction endonuclease subunit S [Escherichia coli]HAJ4364618.1 restriction endonuclease subunit S [Escherichia coli]